MLSRRTFVGWLSSVGAALGFGVRAREVEAKAEAAPEQDAPLNGAMVRGIAEVVLPAELGNDGFARVSRAFTQWAAAYRQGVELVHPYGSTQLRQTSESPAPRWKAQLTALDRDAREKHQRAFTALTREQRRALVMTAFASERANRLPDPVEANHVAMALMAWYFASADAADLCYNARIGRNQCRPLVNSPRQPLPLAGDGRPRTS
ncbi:MAG TPA: gluconate 2-dehydrogenase subunit 3 family protein [Gemmatimonadaceae bacterium]